MAGQDVKNYTADSLMQYISMVFQSVYLFNDTIENNIRFGNPDASHEQIVEAAKRLNAMTLSYLCPKDITQRWVKVALLCLAVKSSVFP